MSSSNIITDPHRVLGLPQHASEEEIRARYLELVKEFPPDRNPDRFREVRAAYEAAKDPLVVARALLQPLDDAAPEWSTVIKEQQTRPPAMSVDFLLSLGNRDDATQSDLQSTPS